MFRPCNALGIPAWLALALALAACSDSGTGPASTSTPAGAVSRLVSRDHYPAAAATCATDTGVTAAVAGTRTPGGTAVATDDRFPVGSITKSMTATLAAILVEEGHLDWDTRLVDQLPEIAATARAEYAGVTLRDLLAHRGGIHTPTDIESLPPLSGTLDQQRAQFTAWVVTHVPDTTVGATRYSNGGYVAAAAMLERAAGGSYEALIQDRLFQPLGMTVTWGVPGAAAGEPAGHARSGSAWVAFDPVDLAAAFPAIANPAGGAKLSAQDLGEYLRLHVRALAGTAGLPLSPASATTLHTVVQDGFALGWLRIGSGTVALDFHNGSDDTSYYAEMALDRNHDLACAVLVPAMSAAVTQDVDTRLAGLLR